MPTAAASFDPDANPDPDRVDFHRERIRHHTFAAGPHFCPGAMLAKLTLEVSYQELAKAVPRFTLAAGRTPRHHAGNVMGMDELVLEVAH